MTTTRLDWIRHAGHHEGQPNGDVFYAWSIYRNMYCEVRQIAPAPMDKERYVWSFYDTNSPEPDVPVARSEEAKWPFPTVVTDLTNYIDGYIYTKAHR